MEQWSFWTVPASAAPQGREKYYSNAWYLHREAIMYHITTQAIPTDGQRAAGLLEVACMCGGNSSTCPLPAEEARVTEILHATASERSIFSASVM